MNIFTAIKDLIMAIASIIILIIVLILSIIIKPLNWLRYKLIEHWFTDLLPKMFDTPDPEELKKRTDRINNLWNKDGNT